ncbi:hypothetical protein J6590_058088 [Homalodisca vitripennis]|nr:hypothetical protein J6590_058088 [Homalodisca vitripennis]
MYRENKVGLERQGPATGSSRGDIHGVRGAMIRAFIDQEAVNTFHLPPGLVPCQFNQSSRPHLPNPRPRPHLSLVDLRNVSSSKGRSRRFGSRLVSYRAKCLLQHQNLISEVLKAISIFWSQYFLENS